MPSAVDQCLARHASNACGFTLVGVQLHERTGIQYQGWPSSESLTLIQMLNLTLTVVLTQLD